MMKLNEEQVDAALFDRSLLAECLDRNIGKRIAPEREPPVPKSRENAPRAA